MIDLQPNIRSFLLSDPSISALLPNYSGSKAIFSRMPVPTDVSYPLIIISPIVTDVERDYVNKERRVLSYDIWVYGSNDTSANYRKVEELAFLVARKMHRLDKTSFSMPSNASLIQVTALGPLPAKVDDQTKTGRAILTNFELILE